MRIGSLFSGYGGADLAVQSVFPDATPAWFVEYDKHPSTILAKRFPGVKNYGDVTTVDWAAVEPVDILTAGWPCQPFSHAGQRRGTDDDRHLWPYVADALRVLRPRYMFGENVAGHLSLGFDTVLADLAGLGFDARWGVVRASDAGAPHRRARLFIVATAADVPGDRWGQGRAEPGQRPRRAGQPAGVGAEVATDTGSEAVGLGTGLRESAAAGLPVPGKSSCFFCPFHRPQTWAEMRRDEPGLFAKSVELEQVLNERREMLGRDPVWLTRFNKPIDIAIPEAQDMLPIFAAGPDNDGQCDSGYCWT